MSQFSRFRFQSVVSRHTADVLNAYYALISSFKSSKEPLTHSILNDILAYAGPTPLDRDKFDFSEIFESKVLLVISQGTSKSTGIDGISVDILKKADAVLARPLTSLVNCSLSQCVFPITWKKAIFLPLSKVKSSASPIQLPSFRNLRNYYKRLVVYDQLLSYFVQHKIISPRPAGVRRSYSTQTALLGVLKDVRYAIEERKITALVLFDLSKGCDSIPHEILIGTLRNINCSDRVQMVQQLPSR